MEMTENSSRTVKIAIRCLKETKCYLEYLNEIEIDKNRWKNLVSYLEYLSSLSSYKGENSLKDLLMRTITFSNTANGAAYWSLKCCEFERKYNSLVNLYCYGLEIDSFADSCFTSYKDSLWTTDYEWEIIAPSYTTFQNTTIL